MHGDNGKGIAPGKIPISAIIVTIVHCSMYIYAYLCTIIVNTCVLLCVLLKLDFRNVFNTVRRDKILATARDMVPEIYPFIFACYSASLT